MNGLYEIAPRPVAVEICGREWKISPLRLADYAEIEQRLLQKRRPPIEVATGAMPGRSDQDRHRILGLAFDEARRGERTSREELNTWLQSTEGILYEFWLRLRPIQPEMTFACLDNLFTDRVDVVSARMVSVSLATGEYGLGNSPSRGPKPTHWAAADRFRGAIFSAA